MKVYVILTKVDVILMDYFQLEDDSVRMRNDLKKILYELRIEATVAVIEMVGFL